MSDEPKTTQINVRAPENAREIIQRIALRLRNDPLFLRVAEGWMDEVEAGQAVETLTARLERLEARVAELARRP